MKMLPVAESGAGEYEKSDDDILRLSAHFDDITDSGKGEVGDLCGRTTSSTCATTTSPPGCS